VFSAAEKPLPFRNTGENRIYYEHVAGYEDLKTKLRLAQNKSIVIDDAQYLMAFEYFSSLNEKGFEKYVRMGNNFFTLLKIAGQLKKDKIVYFMMHVDRGDDGAEKAKTLGKLIEDKLTLEGLFTIVLKTVVKDRGNGKLGYFFATENSGVDRVKTPMEMFDEPFIPNNLKLVDRIIRNYYELPANESVGVGGDLKDKKEEKEVKKDDVEIGEKQPRAGKKQDAELDMGANKKEVMNRNNKDNKVEAEKSEDDIF